MKSWRPLRVSRVSARPIASGLQIGLQNRFLLFLALTNHALELLTTQNLFVPN